MALKFDIFSKIKWREINYLKIAIYSTAFCLAVFILFWRIGSLPGGYSASELSIAETNKIENLLQDPLNMPHKLIALMFSTIFSPLISTRLASASLMFVAVWLFFILIRRWHNQLVAILSSVVFFTSAMLLHYGRFGGYGITIVTFCLALLVVSLSVKYRPRLNYLTTGLLMLFLGLSLYVLGFIWIIVGLVAIKYKMVVKWLKNQSNIKLSVMFLGILALSIPLILWILNSPLNNTLHWLGIDSHPNSMITGLLDLVKLPIYFVVGGYKNSELWLGDLPITSGFVAVMTVLGAYYYMSRYKKITRSKILAVLMISSILLTVLSGFVLLPLLLCFIYIGTAAGIEELRKRWFTVFPRNSLAKVTGIILLSVAVAFSSLYNLRHYFIAWPEAPKTIEVFNVKSFDQSAIIYKISDNT